MKQHDSDGEQEDAIEMADKPITDPNLVKDKHGTIMTKHELERQELANAKVISFRERSPAAFIFNPTR